jgi:3-deoxy-D-manno-octulosonate 8-phosphate phosphatase (KDO 8-P phosphatase)
MSPDPIPSQWPPMNNEEYRDQAVQVLGEELATAFGNVSLLVFDCDGILTPGNLMYGPQGEAIKEFHSHDGLGLVMARIAGLKRAVLTGRDSEIVNRRCTELRFDSIKMGRFDKVTAMLEILEETGSTIDKTLYMGDDLIDIPVMQMAAVAIGVPHAPAEVLDFSHYVTKGTGGHGAVREVTDLVIKSSGQYATTLTRLLDKAWHPKKSDFSSDEELTQ